MRQLLTWMPRAIVLAFILLLIVFALDAFEGPGGVLHKMGGFLLHLLPAAVTAGFLLVAWRWRIIGGLLMLVLGMVFTIYFQTDQSWSRFLLVSFPLLLAGVLFILSNWNAARSSV